MFTPSPRFTLHPWPLALDYSEMERLLLGAAHLLALARKRKTAGGGFDEALGEFLDLVYRRAGVLVMEGGGGGEGGGQGGTPKGGDAA